MSLTIDLPDEAIRALEEEARRSGLSAEAFAQRVLVRELIAAKSSAHIQRSDPREWARRLDDWLDQQDPNRPVLSDDALSRETLYPDRT
jgi:hypothetical protein